MKKILFLLLLLVFLNSGCVQLKTYVTEEKRIDTEVNGNQGYLQGKPVQNAPKKVKSRKVNVLEVQVK